MNSFLQTLCDLRTVGNSIGPVQDIAEFLTLEVNKDMAIIIGSK